MQRCFLVPGFLSSELTYDQAGQRLYWVSYVDLFEAGLDPLRLAPNGIDPGEPGGVQLYATNFVPPYWVRCAEVLVRDLKPHGYVVRLFPWDWRKDIFAAGQDLAADVQRVATPEEPCAMVCHSTGGLVARAAWATLLAAGKQALIRRIVNLSTPDHGTYASAAAWCEIGDYWKNLDTLGSVYNTAWPAIQPFPPPDFRPRNLIPILQTWPCMYQLLPLLDVEDQPADPNRRQIYDAPRWPADRRPSAAHLAMSADVFGPWLRSQVSQPPSWVTTNVWATGYSTPAWLQLPDQLGRPPAVGFSSDGDGVVTRSSSLGTPGKQVEVTCAHEDMPNWTAASGSLVAEILDPRGPFDPPPPPFTVPGIYPTSFTPPPLNGYVGGGVRDDPCGGKVCRC